MDIYSERSNLEELLEGFITMRNLLIDSNFSYWGIEQIDRFKNMYRVIKYIQQDEAYSLGFELVEVSHTFFGYDVLIEEIMLGIKIAEIEELEKYGKGTDIIKDNLYRKLVLHLNNQSELLEVLEILVKESKFHY